MLLRIGKWLSDRWLNLVLVLVAFCLYSNSFQHDYAWDDKLVITKNESTLKGWDGLHEIWIRQVTIPNRNVYRPVTQSTYAIEIGLFGLDPGPSHLINALLYALLVGLCFHFLRVVMSGTHPLFHFAAVLLFAVHPLHVEVVANIKSRDEILAFTFGLLAILAGLKAAPPGKWWWAFPSLALFTLALLAKENALMLVPVLLLAHWYRAGRDFWRPSTLILASISLLVLAGYFQMAFLWALGVTTIAAYLFLILRNRIPSSYQLPALGVVLLIGILPLFGTGETPVAPEQNHGLVSQSSVLNNPLLDPDNVSFVRSTATANFGRYTKLFFYPHPLVHMYGYGQAKVTGPGDAATWIGLGLLLLAVAQIAIGLPKRSPTSFGLSFALITLSVYTNIFVTLPDLMAERFMFVASLGLALATIHTLAYLLGFSHTESPIAAPLWKKALFGLPLLAFVLAFAGHTYGNAKHWENDTTLIENRIKYMDQNAAAHCMLGFVQHQKALEASGFQAKTESYQDALRSYQQALQIYPGSFNAWQQSGLIFAEVGNSEKAELCFLHALQLQPLSADAHSHLGTLYLRSGSFASAKLHLEAALSLVPDHPDLLRKHGEAMQGLALNGNRWTFQQ